VKLKQKEKFKKKLKKEKEMKICDFSKKEQEVIKSELSERIKDLTFIGINKKVDDIFENISKINYRKNDSIEIDYNFGFIFNDILQIVGRIRREIK